MRPTYLHTTHTAQDTECKGVLIRDSDLSACTTAIPMSPDPNPIQSPISITIEFKTDTTKSGGWTLVAQRVVLEPGGTSVIYLPLHRQQAHSTIG